VASGEAVGEAASEVEGEAEAEVERVSAPPPPALLLPHAPAQRAEALRLGEALGCALCEGEGEGGALKLPSPSTSSGGR
jgi:hypothetical protein